MKYYSQERGRKIMKKTGNKVTIPIIGQGRRMS